MSRRAARLVLWGALLVLAPLPFYLVEQGLVPVLRLLWLAGALGAVMVVEGARGMVDVAVALLAAQALLWAGALWIAADLAARVLARGPRRRAAIAVLLLVAAAGAAASVAEPYRTPFRTRELRGSLGEILE